MPHTPEATLQCPSTVLGFTVPEEITRSSHDSGRSPKKFPDHMQTIQRASSYSTTGHDGSGTAMASRPVVSSLARRGNDRQLRSTVGDCVNRWFVVAESSRREDEMQEVVMVPTSRIHAKEMGTLATACGIRCESWPKWWDQSFPPDPEQDSCPRCREIASL